MNRQTWTVAVVGAVSGALGAAMVAGFAGKAFAGQAQAAGKAYVVATTVASVPIGLTEAGGFLFRTWSDGTVDTVAYYFRAPGGSSGSQPDWHNLCNPAAAGMVYCLKPLGFVPPDLNSPADLNNDGIVDGADMGIVLGEWDQSAANR